MTETIPREILDAAIRSIRRRTAAALIHAMGERDINFEQIADRLGREPAEVRKWVYDMVEGIAGELDQISDIACALDCRLDVKLQERPVPWGPPWQQEEQQAVAG